MGIRVVTSAVAWNALAWSAYSPRSRLGLPDWALVSVVEGRDSQLAGTILAEGFFDER